MNRFGEATRESDEQLSELYRDLAVETAPERLNHAILERAKRQAAEADLAWYRSLTFVVSAGMCAALVVAVAYLGDFGTGGTGIRPAAPDSAGTGRILPAEVHCTDEQRATSSSWWRCIRELEQRGLTGAAETELAALLGAYPGFVEPE